MQLQCRVYTPGPEVLQIFNSSIRTLVLLKTRPLLGSGPDVDVQVSFEQELPRGPGVVQLAPLPVHVLCGVVRVLQTQNNAQSVSVSEPGESTAQLQYCYSNTALIYTVTQRLSIQQHSAYPCKPYRGDQTKDRVPNVVLQKNRILDFYQFLHVYDLI